MSEKTDNELIAEFMLGKNNFAAINGSMLYDTSWDWLMPVVEKIENLDGATKYMVEIDDTICKISGRHGSQLKTQIFNVRTYRGGKIKSVYQSVVEFIKWYNQSKS